MNINFEELQKLNPSAIIELYILDLTIKGGGIFYFHAGTNELRQNLIWQGQEYVRYPVKAEGFEITANGSEPRPILKVSNFMSAITTLNMQYDDLTGATVIRRRTLKKYLDAVNFASGVNPTADPTRGFGDDVFYIERKGPEDDIAVEYELVSKTNLAGKKLPARPFIQNYCPWIYRGGECGYAGVAYFDKSDNPTTDPTKDVCSKRLESCKKRFGDNAELPFGGFPGVGLITS